MAKQNSRTVTFGNGGIEIGLGGPIKLNIGTQGLQGVSVGNNFISGDEENGLNITRGNVTVNMGGPNKSGLLVPIGNTGLYHSPDGPVDPWDCERWPDSIYCGGGWNPLTKPLSIDVEVSINKCEVCVTFKPTVVGLAGVPYTICKRSNAPGCNYEEPEPEPDPEPTPDPGAPPPLPPLNDDSTGIFILGYQENTSRGISGSYNDSTGVNTIFLGKDFLPNNDYLYKLSSSSFASHSDYWNSANNTSDSASNEINFCIQYPGNETEWLYISPRTYVYYDVVTKSNKNFTSTSSYLKSNSPLIGTGIIVRGMSNVILFVGAWKTVREFITGYQSQPLQYGTYGSWNDTFSYEWNGETVTIYYSGSRHWSLLYTDLLPEKIKPKKPSFPPPLPLDNPMDCCSENNELLRLLYSKIGGDRLPATLPEYLLADRTKNIQVENIVDFLAWLTKNIDAISGQWPIEIEIEDSNPLEKGNQSKKVPLPNIAESLAELYGMSFKSAVNTDITIQFCMRLAAETIAAKNAALIAQDYVKANAEFLGYKGNPKRREIDYAFDPNNLNSLEEILNESKQNIVGWENQQNETILEFLQRLMYVASLWKARHFKSPKDISKIAQSVQNMAQQTGDSEELWKFFMEALNNPNSYFYGAEKDPNAAPEVKEV